MCRKHAPEAVATLVAALQRPKDAVPAAIALLDRGFGRPRQVIESTDPSSPILLHLLAARAVSAEIIATLKQRPTIAGVPEPNNGSGSNGKAASTTQDLLNAPPPEE